MTAMKGDEQGVGAAAGTVVATASASRAEPPSRLEAVSSDSEPLILVDQEDREIGSLDKAACHDGEGVLHRAFSLFVFNAEGETLLQRRHAGKRLWPGYWSNGCCSHPRPGEATPDAVRRRAQEELGLAVAPRFVFKFQYRAAFGGAGSEFELCSVFVCNSGAETPCVNATEVSEWRWVSPVELDRELENSPGAFTPWLRLEWHRLRGEFREWVEDHRRRGSGAPR